VHIPLIVKPPAGRSSTGAGCEAGGNDIGCGDAAGFAGVKDVIEQQFSSPGIAWAQRVQNEGAAYSETFYPFSSFGWSAACA